MPPKFTLVYFNVRGRGELLRLLFHAAGVQFIDNRVELIEWPALKPNTPDGTLPYLSIDGKDYGESMPLARYIAKKYNLAGKNEIEQLSADIILNYIDDIRNAMGRARNDTMLTDAQKKEADAKIKTEEFPKLMTKLEKRLKESKSGYLVGDGLTIADIAVFDVMEVPVRSTPNVFEKFPNLCEHRKKIQSNSKLAKYLPTRPDTEI